MQGASQSLFPFHLSTQVFHLLIQEPESQKWKPQGHQTGLKRFPQEDSSGVPPGDRHHFRGLCTTAAPPKLKACDTLCAEAQSTWGFCSCSCALGCEQLQASPAGSFQTPSTGLSGLCAAGESGERQFGPEGEERSQDQGPGYFGGQGMGDMFASFGFLSIFRSLLSTKTTAPTLVCVASTARVGLPGAKACRAPASSVPTRQQVEMLPHSPVRKPRGGSQVGLQQTFHLTGDEAQVSPNRMPQSTCPCCLSPRPYVPPPQPFQAQVLMGPWPLVPCTHTVLGACM